MKKWLIFFLGSWYFFEGPKWGLLQNTATLNLQNTKVLILCCLPTVAHRCCWAPHALDRVKSTEQFSNTWVLRSLTPQTNWNHWNYSNYDNLSWNMEVLECPWLITFLLVLSRIFSCVSSSITLNFTNKQTYLQTLSSV